MKFYLLTKALFLKVTKGLYIIFWWLSICIVLIEVIDSGGVSDKGVVFYAFWGIVFSFVLWVSHLWVKHTKYIGLCGVLIALLLWGWKKSTFF